MKMADSVANGQKYVFWVSHALKCLSFHLEPQFERVTFSSHSEMWQMVHHLVERGYTAQ